MKRPTSQRSVIVFVLGFSAASLVAGCSGANVSVRAARARYPLSLSDGIADQTGKLYLVDRDLEVVGHFDARYMEWSTFYGLVHGDRLVDVSDDVNQAVVAHGGDALARVQIEASACAFDWFLILSWLPFWPGCTIVDVEGDVVRRKRPEVQARAD